MPKIITVFALFSATFRRNAAFDLRNQGQQTALAEHSATFGAGGGGESAQNAQAQKAQRKSGRAQKR
jgi:hypothetical protein